MKKILLSAGVAMLATSGAFAQASDVQHATLTTNMNQLMALRPYTGFASATDNQSLTTTVTNATDVLNNNHFDYTGNNGYNGLAYRIYSNSLYSVSIQATPTANSNDQLNNYINYHAETLPSPQNGVAPYESNNNPDHTIDVATDTRLAYAQSTPVQILHNTGANTGKYLTSGAPYSPLDPANTDWAAFGVKFSVSPGFAVFPGVFTTNITITATSL